VFSLPLVFPGKLIPLQLKCWFGRTTFCPATSISLTSPLKGQPVGSWSHFISSLPLGSVPEADCTAPWSRHSQGKFRSIQMGLVRDLNLELSVTALCNQEKATSKGLGKNICKVASYLQPRLRELPSDLQGGSGSFQGSAVTVADQPASGCAAGDPCFSPEQTAPRLRLRDSLGSPLSAMQPF